MAANGCSGDCPHGMGERAWCSVCTHGWQAGAQAEREAIAREGARIYARMQGRTEAPASASARMARSGRTPDVRTFERGSSTWRDRLAYRAPVKRAGVGGPGYVGAARPGVSTKA